MCMKYHDFLERLREERISRQWSQVQMGQKMRMTQSHYSKAEMGSRRFTYYEIKCLCETNFDIYYVFTGHRCKPEYRDYFMKCTYGELKCYLGMLCSVIEHLYENHLLKLEENICRKIEFIQYALIPCKNNKTIFYSLRRGMDYSQKEMADILKIDVKKLRNIENGSVLPDSEIIWRVSEEVGVPFSMMLNDVNGLGGEISYLVELIEGGSARKMFERLKAYHDILR